MQYPKRFSIAVVFINCVQHFTVTVFTPGVVKDRMTPREISTFDVRNGPGVLATLGSSPRKISAH
jgi:hypothetical protein